MDWSGKTITLYAKWEEGGLAFLVAPNKRHPEFTLQKLEGSNPPAYYVAYVQGYMNGNWSHCGALTEVGSGDPPQVYNFPELNDSDPDLDDKCHDALVDVIADLRDDCTQTRRLEGKMSVVFKGHHYVDRVRMVWLKSVVPVSGGGPKDDLVVIDLMKLSGGTVENGGASGPPH